MNTLAFMTGGIGWPEITVVLFLMLLIFGKRLPSMARSLAGGIVEFKNGLTGKESKSLLGDSSDTQKDSVQNNKVYKIKE